MRALSAVLATIALALAACGRNPPADQTNAAAASSNAMPMMASNSAMPMANAMPSNAAMPMTAKTGDSTGVVKSVDRAAGTITLDHQPIPGVGWPAMTMTFKATPSSLLDGVKTGDKVRFSVRIEGQNNMVTAIAKE